MKVKRAVEAAVRWSCGDEAKAVEIIRRQAELDPELRAQIDEEASAYFVEHLIEGFLKTGLYSLERPDELYEAVMTRLKNGPESK
jgi:hypothetical protein